MLDLSSHIEYPNIKKFDDMERVTVVLNFHFPIVSLYKDLLGNKFLISWVDCEDGIDRWVVTPLREGETSKFIYITDSNETSFVKAWKVPRKLVPYGYCTGEADFNKWLQNQGIL